MKTLVMRRPYAGLLTLAIVTAVQLLAAARS
jgi:hypothetical protein